MSVCDHRHDIVLLTASNNAARRIVVGMIYGLQLVPSPDDPLDDICRSVNLARAPKWPDGLKKDAERLDKLFAEERPADMRSDTLATRSQGSVESEEDLIDEEDSEEEDARAIHVLEFELTVTAPLHQYLPRNIDEQNLNMLERLLDRISEAFAGQSSAQPSADGAIRVSLRVFFGSGLLVKDDLSAVLRNGPFQEQEASPIDGRDGATKQLEDDEPPDDEHAAEKPDAGAEDPMAAGVEDDEDAPSDNPTLADGDQSGAASDAPEPATSTDPDYRPVPHSVSFVFETALTPEPGSDMMEAGDALDTILKMRDALDPEEFIFSDVITCCLSDALRFASMLPVANDLEDCVDLLLQDTSLNSVWYKNAWIDIPGTVMSADYRDHVAKQWEKRYARGLRAMDRLRGEGMALLLIDCDFGGLDVAASEVAYLSVPSSLLQTGDEADGVKVGRSSVREHLLFGPATRQLALDDGLSSEERIKRFLNERWRPYRTTALLIGALCGNREGVIEFVTQRQLACRVFP